MPISHKSPINSRKPFAKQHGHHRKPQRIGSCVSCCILHRSLSLHKWLQKPALPTQPQSSLLKCSEPGKDWERATKAMWEGIVLERWVAELRTRPRGRRDWRPPAWQLCLLGVLSVALQFIHSGIPPARAPCPGLALCSKQQPPPLQQLSLGRGQRPAQRLSMRTPNTNRIFCPGKRNDPSGAADQVPELFPFGRSLRCSL